MVVGWALDNSGAGYIFRLHCFRDSKIRKKKKTKVKKYFYHFSDQTRNPYSIIQNVYIKVDGSRARSNFFLAILEFSDEFY